jgi:electron transfer flavoprotein alpha subunit
MSVLIVAEHDNIALKSSTLNVLAAASKIGGDITILVVGENIQTVAQEAALAQGVSKVLVADDAIYAHQLAENIAPLVVKVATEFSHILSCASTRGKDLMPRVAAILDVGQVSDIIEVISPDTFKRPIYAGNAIATVRSLDPVLVVTVRVTAFEPVTEKADSADIEQVEATIDTGLSRFLGEEISTSERPELTGARVVVSGGRGMAGRENFILLEKIADKLGGAVGASRAAVDAGFVLNDLQVGQTGKIVAPDLYIAVGISGAIQHLAGMKDSKVIVAINKDADAPIFQIADYGLVDDLFDALPELEIKL